MCDRYQFLCWKMQQVSLVTNMAYSNNGSKPINFEAIHYLPWCVEHDQGVVEFLHTGIEIGIVDVRSTSQRKAEQRHKYDKRFHQHFCCVQPLFYTFFKIRNSIWIFVENELCVATKRFENLLLKPFRFDVITKLE